MKHEAQLGKIIEGKGPVTVQSATLAALVAIGWGARGYGEQFDRRLQSIEEASKDNAEATERNRADVSKLLESIQGLEAEGAAELEELRREVEERFTHLESLHRRRK